MISRCRLIHQLAATMSVLSESTKIKPDLNVEQIYRISDFMLSRNHLVCITGAGVSTNSGIPDYRGVDGSYSKGHKPMVHSDFINNEYLRKRYWARSLVGWTSFSQAKPNMAHYSLAVLEHDSLLKFLITQNVDQLHQKAGSRNVLDLHGRNDEVRCLTCNTKLSRRIMQSQIELLNPDFSSLIYSLDKKNLRADGDAELSILDFDKVIIHIFISIYLYVYLYFL